MRADGSTLPALRALHRRTLDMVDGPPLPLVLARFDAAGFRPDHFARAGLEAPPSLRRSVVRRQAEFFFGRLAARRALQDLDPRLADSAIGIGPAREPQWPAGIVGSISHTDALAVASVARSQDAAGLGLDIEAVAAPADLDAMLRLALNAEETARLRQDARDPAEFAWRCTLAFSAKESLYKAVYPVVGRYVDFSAATLTALDTSGHEIELTLAEDLHRDYPSGRRLRLRYADLGAGVWLTVCRPGRAVSDLKTGTSNR